MKYLYFIVGLFIFLYSCTTETTTTNPVAQLDYDKAIIKEYIKQNGYTVDSTKNFLYYSFTSKGTGTTSPTVEDTAKAYYIGYYVNGKVFDKRIRPNIPFEFPIKSVILGWQEILPLMKNGDKVTIFVPSSLGYGTAGSGSIPGNTILIFDIELQDFY